MCTGLGRWLRSSYSDRGQTLMEYALIIGVIALGMVLALSTFASDVGGFYAYVHDAYEAIPWI